MKSRKPSHSAFTIIELFVVIAIIAVLAAIQLPALANTKSKVQRIHCSDNLKRVGLAFRTWAENHDGRLPMQVSRNNGGASEAVGMARSATQTWTTPTFPHISQRVGVWMMFIVMSNELNTPKILYCPSEGAQSHSSASPIGPQATVFGPQLPGAGAAVGFQNDLNASYFVGVDAHFVAPNRFLAGDHNLGYGAGQATKVGSFISAGTNANWLATSIGWQANNHNQQGNVLLADGSAQNFTSPQFRNGLNNTGDSGRTAGVFATPVGSFGVGVNRLQFP